MDDRKGTNARGNSPPLAAGSFRRTVWTPDDRCLGMVTDLPAAPPDHSPGTAAPRTTGRGRKDWPLARLRPGQLRCDDVRLLDLESQQPLVQLPRLTARATGQGWHLHIPEATLPESALRSLWQIVHQRLIREDELAGRIAHVAVERLVVHHDFRDLTLHDVNWSRVASPTCKNRNCFSHCKIAHPRKACASNYNVIVPRPNRSHV